MTPILTFLKQDYPKIYRETIRKDILSEYEERDFIKDLRKNVLEQTIPEWREHFVCLAMQLAALNHFGFSKITQLNGAELLNLFHLTVERTVDYYRGDWWTPENVAKWIEQYGQRLTEWDRLRYARGCWEMGPDFPKEQELDRHDATGAILACVFTGKLAELTRICDWFDLRIVPGENFPERRSEDEFEMAVLYLISRFRGEPIPGIEKLLKKIERCRFQRPKVLLKLIDAVFDGDLAAYHELLPAALELHFERYPFKFLSQLAAWEESALVEYARRKGMEPPLLAGRAQFALVTPQTLGFPE